MSLPRDAVARVHHVILHSEILVNEVERQQSHSSEGSGLTLRLLLRPCPGRGYPGKAVSGAYPHTLDRGRYRLWGRGRRGGGKSPRPCLWFQYAGIPPPLPASGLLPRPEGRGQSWRYPRKAVSGRVNPRASSFFRLFPIRWTVGGISTGEGQTGREQKPPPLSLVSVCRHPPPRAGFLFRLFPIRWTVGGISTGEGQTGRGQKAPSSVSAFNMRVPPLLSGVDMASRETTKVAKRGKRPRRSQKIR